MSRTEQWIAFVIALIAIGGTVTGGTYWYMSKEAPGLIQIELDKRDALAVDNKPDEIVEALTELSTKVESLTTSQAEMREDMQEMRRENTESFQFLVTQILEL